MADVPDIPTTPAAAKSFLKARMFGMPRWVFLAMLAAGIGVGIYLRRRQAKIDDSQDSAADIPDTSQPGLADTIAGNLDDPGLAGTGVYAQPAGAITPVESPIIPSGYPETAGIGGDIAIAALQALSDVTGTALTARDPAVQGTGVRPPKRHPHHHPPRHPHPGHHHHHGKGHHPKGVGPLTSPTGGGPPTVSRHAHRPIHHRRRRRRNR